MCACLHVYQYTMYKSIVRKKKQEKIQKNVSIKFSVGKFAGMAYSKCGLTDELYRRTKISLVRQVNGFLMKYNILLLCTLNNEER